jgi:hypothetical protein
VPRLKGAYTSVGGPDAAFEIAVSDAYFQFWQYSDPASAKFGCQAIPRDGSVEKAFQFLKTVSDPDALEDAAIGEYLAYFYQAATQLGAPEGLTFQIQDLLLYPTYNPEIGSLPYSFSNAAMIEMAQWARTGADKIIYVYGELDPWSAGAFPVSETGKETYKYVKVGGNHSANFERLAQAQREEAIATLARWLGKQPVSTFMPAGERTSVELPTLEEVELHARRRLHLL